LKADELLERLTLDEKALLTAGAASVVLAGGVALLVQQEGDVPGYRAFRGEPRDLRGVPGASRPSAWTSTST
jgi:hypothetical protein